MALGDASYGGGQTLGEGKSALTACGGHRHQSPGVSSDRPRSGHGAGHGYDNNSARPSPFHGDGSCFSYRRGHKGKHGGMHSAEPTPVKHGYGKRSAEPSYHNRLMRSAITPPGKHGYWKRSAEPSFGYGVHHNRLMRSAETPPGKHGYWKRSAEPSFGHGGHHRLMRSADGHGGPAMESSKNSVF